MWMDAMLARWGIAPAPRARSGQITILFALMLTTAVGMVGLAVDVGHAYERRQFIQGAAYNAARAGAFEVYADHKVRTSPVGDTAVVHRMVDTLKDSGLTVANYVAASDTLTTPSSTAACGHLTTNSAYLQAVYLDSSNSPISGSTGQVGNTAHTMPPNADGVMVTNLATCVPHFFVGALKFGDFNVGSSAFVGLAETTPSSSAGSADAPFYIFGQVCDSSTTANCPYSLYAQNSTSGPGSYNTGLTPNPQPAAYTCPDPITGVVDTTHPTPCTGDLVTIHDSGNGQGNWGAHQFMTPADGRSNTVSTVFSLHDESNRGCLDPSALSSSLMVGAWSWNHGGDGSSCASPPPTDGSTVLVPIVDAVCKDSVCPYTAPSSPCISGGYCVRIMGWVQVYIVRDLNDGQLVQGYITKVVEDPFCIVQADGVAADNNPHPTALDYGTSSPPTGLTWPTAGTNCP